MLLRRDVESFAKLAQQHETERDRRANAPVRGNEPKFGSNALWREAFAARMKPFQNGGAPTYDTEKASIHQATQQPKSTPKTDVRQRWKPDNTDSANKGQSSPPRQALPRTKPLPTVLEENKQTAELHKKRNARGAGNDLEQSRGNFVWKR